MKNHGVTVFALLSLMFFCVNISNAKNPVIKETKNKSAKSIVAEEATLSLHFDFKSLNDNIKSYQGKLNNGARLDYFGEYPILDLGTQNGYFDLGASTGNVISVLNNFTISVNVFIPQDAALGSAGNFIFTFANSTDIAGTKNGCIFFGANSTRYAITKTNYSNEVGLQTGNSFPKERWCNLVYRQKNGVGSIFIDGIVKKVSASMNLAPSALGITQYNFLGKSCYKNDNYLKGAKYNEFRVYDGALSDDSISGLSKSAESINIPLFQQQIAKLKESLKIGETDIVTQNITLPLTGENDVTISWKSSNEFVLSSGGVVNRPEYGQKEVVVTLEATISKGSVSDKKQFVLRVLPKIAGKECVDFDLSMIKLKQNIQNLRSDLDLPFKSYEGSVLRWKSLNQEYISNNGKLRKLSPKGEGKKSVIMRITAQSGDYIDSLDIQVNVAEDEGMDAYLFAYFTGNAQSDEQIKFALSMDGYNYTPLNNGNRILSSDTIAIKKAVRDPHILRGEDGKTFYMVVTDMRSGEGWSSNDGLVLLKSDDLINWKHTAIDFPSKWPALFDRNDLTQVWAPQTIYDQEEGKYMVYFSIGKKSQNHYMIYYSYANEDFTDLTQPKVLYDHGANTIDGDIVFANGEYHLFFKTEGQGNGIQKATSKSLKGPWVAGYKYLQQTTLSVEGSGVFRKINSNDWILMYDCYMNGFYQFCSSSDLENFSFICNTSTSGSFTPRHGTTITITAEEAKRLLAKWPASGLSNLPLGARNLNIRQAHVKIDHDTKTVLLPVGYGTDIKSFNPELYGYAGTNVTPAEFKDFSKGPLKYTFSMQGKPNLDYMVDVRKFVNPVLPGFHADPEVMYSKKTGRFYIYSTTDGFPGWGGTYFEVYSSADLVEWKYEGRAIDLGANQAVWATGNAWAPAIEEKLIDGSYRYYFYFSGNAGSNKQIGVAVANNPEGPFIDSGASIVKSSPTGRGQQIDVDVFTDPVSGKSFLYWGNGYMAVAELNDDMLSIKENTIKVITPEGGTLQDYAYREAPYVFYRKGLYYFLWSVDDTGSPNYHVAYGTSPSPAGPITVAEEPVVLIQDTANFIYGPAHNSVLQIPGKDEWYIVYHRINREYINKEPGIHREVCIDRLQFDDQGKIIKVKPTLESVNPVSVNPVISSLKKIRKITSDAKLKKTQYYSMSGKLLGSVFPYNYKGVAVKRVLFEDGLVCNEKVIN